MKDHPLDVGSRRESAGFLFAAICGAIGYWIGGGPGAFVGVLAGYGAGWCVARFARGRAVQIILGIVLIAAVTFVAANYRGWRARLDAKAAAGGVASRAIEFANGCDRELRLYARWSNLAWGTKIGGPWRVRPNSTLTLSEGIASPVQATSPEIYFYADAPGSTIAFTGDRIEKVEGRALPMRLAEAIQTPESYRFGVDCEAARAR